jgi:hypothetical protein
MAAAKQEKAFCVLDYAQCKSVTTVQRNFRRRFGKDPPTRKTIHDWYRKFETTGCLCKGKSPGRPPVSEENVKRIRQAQRRQSPKLLVNFRFHKPPSERYYVSVFTCFVKILYNRFPKVCNPPPPLNKVLFSAEATKLSYDAKLSFNCRVRTTLGQSRNLKQLRWPHLFISTLQRAVFKELLTSWGRVLGLRMEETASTYGG